MPAPVESVSKDTAAIFWAILGYSLVAIVIYLVLEKNISSALGGAGGLLGRAAKSWVEPTDPIAAITGSTGGSAGASSAEGAAQVFSAPSKPAPGHKLATLKSGPAVTSLIKSLNGGQIPTVANHA